MYDWTIVPAQLCFVYYQKREEHVLQVVATSAEFATISREQNTKSIDSC